MNRSTSFSSRKGTSARRLVSVALVLSVGAFIGIAACSNQGEGERCEVLNGNDDCADGLVCYSSDLLGRGSNTDRCCPAIRENSTHPYCKVSAGELVEASTPADTGPAPATDAGDGGTDANTSDASDASDAADQ